MVEFFERHKYIDITHPPVFGFQMIVREKRLIC